MKKRYIEESFPLEKLSELSQKEKGATRKTLSALHLWWARRPLTLSRAVIAASILPAPNGESERKKIEDLLGSACTLDAGAGRKDPSSDLKELMRLIKNEFPKGKRLSLLDPFAGGGSIPFEARRLGLDVYANDLNPVSYLVRKASLELIPGLWGEKAENDLLGEYTEETGLLEDFDKWSDWLYNRVKEEIGEYFEEDTLNYLWVKTCHCKSCGREIPLLNMKISRKKGNIINPQVIVDKENGTFDIRISSASPSELRNRKGVICPFCEMMTTTLDDVKEEGTNIGLGKFPICKYVQVGKRQREIRLLTDDDKERELRARERMEELRNDTEFKHYIPTDKAPNNEARRWCNVDHYGYTSFDKFYSPRQLLTITTLIKYVSMSYEEMLKDGMEERRAKLMSLLLVFIVDKMAVYNNVLCTWHSKLAIVTSVFGSPDFRMSWDFPEVNPMKMNGSGTFGSMRKSVRDAIQNVMINFRGKYEDFIGTATKTEFESEYFDLIVTDPPYYDYIGYSYLSDFFYSLLRRMISKEFSEAFTTPLTPKIDELILSQKSEENIRKLEQGLLEAWKEVHRILNKGGTLVVMFTHRSTEAWEQLFSTLHQAGFYATATWPVLSESLNKLTQGRANVNVTLLIVCRKRDPKISKIGDYREVTEELREIVYEKAESFWKQGLSRADFFVAIQGPAMEVFAKYDHVEKNSGEEVALPHFLGLAREYVGDFVLQELFKFDPSVLDDITRFYIMWRWSYGVTHESFDDYLLFCKVNSVDEKYLVELDMVTQIKKGNKNLVQIKQYQDRDLPWNDWETQSYDPSVISKLQLALKILDKGSYSSFTSFMKSEGATDQSHPIIHTALVLETILRPIADAGNTVPEHSMLQKLLDSKGVKINEKKNNGNSTLDDFDWRNTT